VEPGNDATTLPPDWATRRENSKTSRRSVKQKRRENSSRRLSTPSLDDSPSPRRLTAYLIRITFRRGTSDAGNAAPPGPENNKVKPGPEGGCVTIA
jgi:hypothetical protein